MIRCMLIPYGLFGAMAVAVGAEEKTVKPESLETKKTADTQIFVTTDPKGAKVIVEGRDVGSSPHLLVVPAGATKMTIVVELDGYEKGERTVEVRGGKVTRVVFDMKKAETSAQVPRSTGHDDGRGEGKATGVAPRRGSAKAEPEDYRTVANRFGEALAAADESVLETLWELDDPLDRQAADLILAAVRKSTRQAGRAPRVDLVHCARTGAEHMLACYYADGIPLFDGRKPSPIFQSFRLKDGRWRTVPLSNLRGIATARSVGPEAFGRRALLRKLIDLRFGALSHEERIASMRAIAEAQEALSQPPYNLSQFEKAGEAFRRSIEEFAKVASRPWPEIEKTLLPEDGIPDVGSPGDFYLTFYLEATEGQDGRRIPGAEEAETLVVERIPCLTEEEVEKAEVVRSPDDLRPSVAVKLSEFGAKVLGRATKENLGKRLAIVVDGKIVSAPRIRSEIGGGNAIITGDFSLAEAEKIAEQLNSHREVIRRELDSMREKLDAWPERQ